MPMELAPADLGPDVPTEEARKEKDKPKKVLIAKGMPTLSVSTGQKSFAAVVAHQQFGRIWKSTPVLLGTARYYIRDNFPGYYCNVIVASYNNRIEQSLRLYEVLEKKQEILCFVFE